jgi:hypothetical protein
MGGQDNIELKDSAVGGARLSGVTSKMIAPWSSMRVAESNSGEADSVETGSGCGWVGSGVEVAEQAAITKVKIKRREL